MTSFNHIPSGLSTDSAAGVIRNNGIYIGIVKKNDDAQRMGRLAVYIPELGGDASNPSTWFVVSYASPFAGATNFRDIKDDQTEDGTQKSYGFWAVPPDINNEVLVCFVNGDTSRGFWFACLWQQNMNHMVPGIAANVSTDRTGDDTVLPPVAEYNKSNANNTTAPARPTFRALADGLVKQGLARDYERGPASTSARREAPSKAYGLLTPRGNSISIDDNEANEFIRLRTRSGAQVLIHETTGYVYINSKDGNAWVEISDSGVDIYSANSVSVRAEKDINFRADQNIIFDAGQNIFMRSGLDINTSSGRNTVMGVGKNLIQSADAASLRVEGDRIVYAGGALRVQSGGDTSMLAGGNHVRSAARISDNGSPAPAADAPAAQVPQGKATADKGGSLTNTITSRMPTHEPWVGHPRADLPPAQGEGMTEEDYRRAMSRTGHVSDGDVTTATPQRSVQTGEGERIVNEPMDGTRCPLGVGTRAVSNETFNAIKEACDRTGVPMSYMLAMADRESGFNPQAAARTSSAKGLYQFIDGTWDAMVARYGGQDNVGRGDVFSARANALMGARYTQENMAVLRRAGVTDPSPGQLYMCHFLGGGGATTLIRANQQNPNASAADLLPAAARANRSIFYNRDGTPKTVGEVYKSIESNMNGRAAAYASQYGLPPPCDRGSSGETVEASAPPRQPPTAG